MADQQPTGYYLYLSPWIAHGYLVRPMWIVRVFQRVVFGWRWYANENPSLFGMSAASPTECEPYKQHLPAWVMDLQTNLSGGQWDD